MGAPVIEHSSARPRRAGSHVVRPWLFQRLLAALVAALVGWPLAQATDANAADHAALAPLSSPTAGQAGAAWLPPRRADFAHETPSLEVRQLADWIVDSNDSPAMPFALVDKKNAKVYVFYADGRLHAAAPALLGLAVGDDAVPGIGERKLSSIRPEERTTPAGRFVASLAHNIKGQQILWVDYHGAVSLHPVVKGTPQEQRAQRLISSSPLDNRISYGCINVPVDFFHTVVKPAFTGTNGVVYVLPETRPAQQVFASYDVDARALTLSVQQASNTQAALQSDNTSPTR